MHNRAFPILGASTGTAPVQVRAFASVALEPWKELLRELDLETKTNLSSLSLQYFVSDWTVEAPGPVE